MRKTFAILIILIFVVILLALQILTAKNEGYSGFNETVENFSTEEIVLQEFDKERESLYLSEIMLKNNAAYRSESGEFASWIELANTAEETIPLKGWQLSDGKKYWEFPEVSIPSESYLVVYMKSGEELSTDFSLSSGEVLSIIDPNGDVAMSVEVPEIGSNHSFIIGRDGAEKETAWITPGYENTSYGYEKWQSLLPVPDGPIIINEVANSDKECDWIEIKNTSSDAVELSSFFLSDKSSNLQKWQFPEQTLASGEIVLLVCSEEKEQSNKICVPFSLSVPDEHIWLSDNEGKLIDYLYIHDVPVNGSCGRYDGKTLCYYTQPSPGTDNPQGNVRVSAEPIPSILPMTYDSVDELKLELYSDGKIYYTTDCTVPEAGVSEEYTGPIIITENTIVRAVSVEAGACASNVATYSYIINQHRTLPVLSMVVDDYQYFLNFFYQGWKNYEVAGNLELFDGEEVFNNACGVVLKGWSSLSLPKKSFGVYFRGIYGDGKVKQDLFDNGIDSYSSLSIRTGQDYTYAVIRNELFENLCADVSDTVLTQSGKYCAMYINGKYWGLYCLKENINEEFVADRLGISESSVYMTKGPVAQGEDLEKLIMFTWYNDMSDEENYKYFTSKFNEDSLIDWLILEGYCGNSDTVGNIRYFSSPEYDNGRYQLIFYDLDWGFSMAYFCFTNMFEGSGNSGIQVHLMADALVANKEFRDKFLTRFSELIKTELSNESILSRIEVLVDEVRPEIVHDRERWDLTISGFETRVSELKGIVIDNNYQKLCVDNVCRMLNVTAEEREMYFGVNEASA